MKRIKDGISHITPTVVMAAAHKAYSARRRKTAQVRAFMERLAEEAPIIAKELRDGTWTPLPTVRIVRNERGKERVLDIPRFRDVVAQRALLAGTVGRKLVNAAYPHTYSSILGRGSLKAAKHVARLIRHRSARWCLYFDIRKYYERIDRDLIKRDIRALIKCSTALRLLDRMIDMAPGPGISIGNTASHLFANLYLTPVLIAAEHMEGVHAVVAYMDNVLIFGPNKRKLHAARRDIIPLLAERRLTMKRDWQVFRTDLRRVDCFGFRLQRGRPWRLSRLTFKHLLRSARRFAKTRARRQARRFVSLYGWATSARCRGLTIKLQPLFNSARKLA